MDAVVRRVSIPLCQVHWWKVADRIGAGYPEIYGSVY